MTAEITKFTHKNMSPGEILEFCLSEHTLKQEYGDVIIVSLIDGKVELRNSKMSREFATYLLLEAIDVARGKL